MKINTSIYDEPGVLDSEDLVDKAYEGLMAIMDLKPKRALSGRQIGGLGRTMQVYQPLVHGIYIHGSPRTVYFGHFDVGIDELPQEGCVYRQTLTDNSFGYVVVKKINKLPSHVWNVCRNPIAVYESTYVEIVYGWRESRKADKDRSLLVDVLYFQIASDGAVYATQDTRKRAAEGKTADHHNAVYSGSGALSSLADRKYLWLVNVKEKIEDNIKAFVQFGIDMDYVKSLFYARSLPLTPSGRKRPILHWVSAHKRRIKSGIDVDVIKHLRGIERFEMGELNFEITQPVKASRKVA